MPTVASRSRGDLFWSVVVAAWLSRLNVATVETPGVDAVAVNRPGTPLATKGGDVASPFESVLALGSPPRKFAPAPVGPGTIAKATVTPCTGLPFASVTRACSGCP